MPLALLVQIVALSNPSQTVGDQTIWNKQTDLLFLDVDKSFQKSQREKFLSQPPPAAPELSDWIFNMWITTHKGHSIVKIFKAHGVSNLERIAFLMARAYIERLHGRRLSPSELISKFTIYPTQLPTVEIPANQ